MNWLETWAMIQVIGMVVPFLIISIAIIYFILVSIFKKAQEK